MGKVIMTKFAICESCGKGIFSNEEAWYEDNNPPSKGILKCVECCKEDANFNIPEADRLGLWKGVVIEEKEDY